MVKELWRSDASLQSHWIVKLVKNAYVSLCQHFFETLSCKNCVRKQQITMVLWQFWSAFNALSVCVSWFLIELLEFLPDLDHMAPHGLNPRDLIDLMAHISKSTRNWHVQNWFSHCRCNVASFKYKINFLPRGCKRSSKSICSLTKVERSKKVTGHSALHYDV